MKTILIIRRTREYYQDNIVDPGHKRFRYGWDLFFNLKYLEFRRRLSDIALSSFSAGKFDKVYQWQDEEIYEEVNKEGNIVFACDEDDWIHPSLANELRSFNFQDKPVVKWNVVNINYHGEVFLDNGVYCRSCGYAVKMPYQTMCIRVNTMMSDRGKDIIKLPKVLSVKVDNLSSLSFLEQNNYQELLNYVKERSLVKKVALIQEYEQQVDLYNELLKELYDSCKV